MTTIGWTLTDQDRAVNRGRWEAIGTAALADLAALERECCAFATWTLSEYEGRVALEIAGKTDDAVPAVQALFASLRSRR